MIRQLVVGQTAANCYIYADDGTGQALIVDPGDDAGYIGDFIGKHQLDPVMIVATHGHFDHILAVTELQVSYAVPFYMHPADTFLLDRMGESSEHFLGVAAELPPPVITGPLGDGDVLHIGGSELTVLAVPGHTPGSIALSDDRMGNCFVGDLLFAGGGVGRTDFRYADPDALAASVARMLSLPPSTVLYPGHGPVWTVRDARREHPDVV